jgi:hypothetical protein
MQRRCYDRHTVMSDPSHSPLMDGWMDGWMERFDAKEVLRQAHSHE